MKLLFDFFPIVLFFVFFKFSGIYTATIVSIVAVVIQVAIVWIKNRRVDTSYKITLFCMLILGGSTLFFHNPLFIKLKPTIIYWISAIVLIISSSIGKSNLVEKLMGKNIVLSPLIWKRMNFSWAGFLLLMGTANLYVAYSYNTDIWVNFKFFGGLGLTVLFVLIQAVYLSRCAHFTFGDTQR